MTTFTCTASDGPASCEVEVLRQLGPDEVDEEVGAMFKVRLPDGSTYDAFVDELSPAPVAG
jgi:hypothetical protein